MIEKFLAVLGLVFLRLLNLSYRFQYQNIEFLHQAKAISASGAIVYAAWHQNALACILGHRNQGICNLISKSKDGEIIANICSWLGYEVIRGSSSRGGSNAMSELVTAAEMGKSCAITVDGPRGPRHYTKPGVVSLSSKASMAILPLSAIASSYWEFNSWDRFRLPKPFSKILICYGDPFVVPKNLEAEQFEICRNKVDTTLIDLEKSAPVHSR